MRGRRISQHDQEDPSTNPALSEVVENNIRTLLRLRRKREQERNLEERLADGITLLSGRMAFIYLHILWFGGWIFINNGDTAFKVFDPYPYGLLTMIVSLEAIFLSAFVLISQNRMAQEADRRADLDVQINLLNEAEMTHALKMLHAIHKKLSINEIEDPTLKDFTTETSPEHVLAEIARLQKDNED